MMSNQTTTYAASMAHGARTLADMRSALDALDAENAALRATNERLCLVAVALHRCVDFGPCDDMGEVGYAVHHLEDGDLAPPEAG